MKAFILAAGLGTRLKPFTNHHPKALATINGITLLELAIKKLQENKIFHIVINVHHFAQQIIDLLEKENGFGSKFEISDESCELLETGGGLKKAAPFLRDEKDFVMMNVDILSDIQLLDMIQFHQQSNAVATLAVQNRQSSRYLLFDEHQQLGGWKNVKTNELKLSNPTFSVWNERAFSGIQVLNSSIFDHMFSENKFSIIDVYLELCKKNKVLAWDHSNDFLMDAGRPENIKKAEEMNFQQSIKNIEIK